MSEDTTETYVEFLRGEMYHLKLNQVGLAQKLNFSESYLSHILNGSKKASGKFKARVHEEFDTSLDEIIKINLSASSTKVAVMSIKKEAPYQAFRMHAAIRGRNQDRINAQMLRRRKTPSPKW